MPQQKRVTQIMHLIPKYTPVTEILTKYSRHEMAEENNVQDHDAEF